MLNRWGRLKVALCEVVLLSFVADPYLTIKEGQPSLLGKMKLVGSRNEKNKVFLFLGLVLQSWTWEFWSEIATCTSSKLDPRETIPDTGGVLAAELER